MRIIKFLLRPVFHLFTLYITNYFVSFIPIRIIRNFWLRMCMRMKIGKQTYIDLGCFYMQPWNIKIGSFTHINRGCFLDGRGVIEIGDSVSISHKVNIVTGSHDVNSVNNQYITNKIEIHDYAFIGVGATILQGVKIGKGAVVCAGACVTKDLEPFGIYAGIPAKKIGNRIQDLNYKCNPETFFC